jgi:membrane-anchored protein YejM (alkaline phosphatase superfamily)
MSTTKEKILELVETVQHPPSWWWKVIGGVVVSASILWVRWLLSHRADEITKAREELAAMKLKAMQDDVKASTEIDTAKRNAAMMKVVQLHADATKMENEIVVLEADHAKSMAEVQAIQDKDWVTLNKLAGVPIPVPPAPKVP